jgi:hypothetical protein
MKSHHESCRPKHKLASARKRTGPITDCRHGFPRPLALKAEWTSTGSIQQRRRSHWINNYNPFLLVSLRCNHDIKHMWGTDTNQLSAMVYATNYMTKTSRKLLNTVICVRVGLEYSLVRSNAGLHQEALGRYNKNVRTRDRAPEVATKIVIEMVHNQLQRDVELSLQTVVACLAGYPERYVSHIPVLLLLQPFVDWVESEDAEQEVPELPLHPAHRDTESFGIMSGKLGRQLTIYNQRMDYCLRPAGLSDCCLYDFRMCWDKVKLSKRNTARDWNQHTLDLLATSLEDGSEPTDDVLQQLLQGKHLFD